MWVRFVKLARILDSNVMKSLLKTELGIDENGVWMFLGIEE